MLQGPLALYRGLPAQLVGIMPEKALKLTLYNALRTAMIDKEVSCAVPPEATSSRRTRHTPSMQPRPWFVSTSCYFSPPLPPACCCFQQTQHVTHGQEALAGRSGDRAGGGAPGGGFEGVRRKWVGDGCWWVWAVAIYHRCTQPTGSTYVCCVLDACRYGHGFGAGAMIMGRAAGAGGKDTMQRHRWDVHECMRGEGNNKSSGLTTAAHPPPAHCLLSPPPPVLCLLSPAPSLPPSLPTHTPSSPHPPRLHSAQVLITNPYELIKIRQQTIVGQPIGETMRELGLRGLTKVRGVGGM